MTIAERAVFSRSAGSSRPRIDRLLDGRLRAPATDTGSVTASVARLTALSGPMTSTGARLRRHRADDEAGRRTAVDRGHDRHLARRRRLERHRDRRRRHLHDLDAERHPHLLGRQRKQAAARLRGVQIEHRDDVAGADAAERARRAAHADVDGRRHVAVQLEAGRHLLQLERHAQAALDGLLAGHDHPEQQRQPERQQLQPEVAERPSP